MDKGGDVLGTSIFLGIYGVRTMRVHVCLMGMGRKCESPYEPHLHELVSQLSGLAGALSYLSI